MTLEELQKKLNKRLKINKKRGSHWKVFSIPPSLGTSISGKMVVLGKNYLRCGNMKGQIK